MNSLDPFEAAYAVTFSPDCKSARINRFGIGYGQRGYWGNKHFDTMEAAEAAFDKYLAEVREIYSRDQNGKFIEESALASTASPTLLRRIQFVPILKSGKRGKNIHTVHLYKIEVSAEKEAEIKKLLSVPVVD